MIWYIQKHLPGSKERVAKSYAYRRALNAQRPPLKFFIRSPLRSSKSNSPDTANLHDTVAQKSAENKAPAASMITQDMVEILRMIRGDTKTTNKILEELFNYINHSEAVRNVSILHRMSTGVNNIVHKLRSSVAYCISRNPTTGTPSAGSIDGETPLHDELDGRSDSSRSSSMILEAFYI